MSIEKSIQRIQDDIENQTKRLTLYLEMKEIFKEIEFPEGVSISFYRYANDKVRADFSPGYEDNSEKDLQPLVHQLSQKLGLKFAKERSYDEESLEYSSTLEVNSSSISKILINVSGVVPKTCRIVETEIPLSDEELEKARRDAVESVKTFRVEKKIVCD